MTLGLADNILAISAIVGTVCSLVSVGIALGLIRKVRLRVTHIARIHGLEPKTLEELAHHTADHIPVPSPGEDSKENS